MKLRNTIAPVLVGAALLLGAVACSPHNTSHHVTAAQSAQAKKDARELTKCLPRNTYAQLKLAKTLDTKSGRHNLEQSCGVPSANKQRFEAEVLQAAESGHLTTRSGRATFFEVTLPGIVERNQK